MTLAEEKLAFIHQFVEMVRNSSEEQFRRLQEVAEGIHRISPPKPKEVLDEIQSERSEMVASEKTTGRSKIICFDLPKPPDFDPTEDPIAQAREAQFQRKFDQHLLARYQRLGV